ncbi:tyrosine protein phosphatase [Bacillus sp. FJAT-42376]|uniref:tyrosine-protein phosphatase n=1 Tax=Bacillus sp. FJAT-42376 TaxID=2014076 RepID=UPI000F4EEEF2|nr:CpsB/CapC family capsule biosynthesis tyrosine phosphatase [Bacillus sp. FJAT-42376]AZB44670.1 tyrosine protein phosphatase [Bacillus sp. FJAT-42376]
MIDIHCHILPGADDGASSMLDSLEMARAAALEGITRIVATPHHRNGRYDNEKETVVNSTRMLNGRLREESIPVTIYPGQEVRIYGDLVNDLKNGDILPVNHTEYLLVELPHHHVPQYTSKLFYDLQLQGITPVIVHPERNIEILKKPDILSEFINRGALSQITAASLTGEFGRKIKKRSLDLISNGMAHFIASDAHNVSSRGFALSHAYNVLNKEFGTPYVFFFKENAELMLSGQTIAATPPQRKRTFRSLFKS